VTDWSRRKLSAVLRIQNGFAFDSKQFTADGGTPLIRIRDLKCGLSTETNFVGPFDQRYVVHAGDFLIGMDGEFACFEWRGPDALLNQRVCKLTGFADGIEPRFLFYGINSYLKDIEDVTTFTTVKHLSSKQIADIDFPLPPLQEQRRIVAVLDEAFAAIATATANAEKNLANVRELFESEIERQVGWKEPSTVMLEDLADGITDGDHQPPPKATSGVPFITISNIIKDLHEIDFSNTFLVPRAYYEALNPKRRPRRGDILYTVTGSFGIPVVVDEGREFCFQRHVGLIRPKGEVDSRWLYYVLRSQTALQQAHAAATGTAQRTVGLKALRSFSIPNIPPAEQKRIARRLDCLRSEVELLSRCQAKRGEMLAELRQSLLHRAFSGELTQREPLAA